MSLYSLSFGFRQPYQVLGLSHCVGSLTARALTTRDKITVDSEFCKDANGLNTDVLKQVTTVLQGSVKPSESLINLGLWNERDVGAG